jgi:dynein heavy chain 2
MTVMQSHIFFYRNDCLHFNMTEPEFETALEVKVDLARYEGMWGLFEEFNNGLQDLAKEDWISFRGRCYMFEEFLGHWYEKLKNDEPTTMTVRLQKEIDKYKVPMQFL